MNTTTQIEFLLNNGFKTFTFGKTPEGKLFVQAAQGVTTGPEGNMTMVQHQRANMGLTDCLEALQRAVIHCNELQQRGKSANN